MTIKGFKRLAAAGALICLATVFGFGQKVDVAQVKVADFNTKEVQPQALAAGTESLHAANVTANTSMPRVRKMRFEYIAHTISELLKGEFIFIQATATLS